jgi:hypothetical protein
MPGRMNHWTTRWHRGDLLTTYVFTSRRPGVAWSRETLSRTADTWERLTRERIPLENTPTGTAALPPLNPASDAWEPGSVSGPSPGAAPTARRMPYPPPMRSASARTIATVFFRSADPEPLEIGSSRDRSRTGFSCEMSIGWILPPEQGPWTGPRSQGGIQLECARSAAPSNSGWGGLRPPRDRVADQIRVASRTDPPHLPG